MNRETRQSIRVDLGFLGIKLQSIYHDMGRKFGLAREKPGKQLRVYTVYVMYYVDRLT